MADSVVLVTKWKAANETDFLIHVTGIVCKIKNKTTRAAKENSFNGNHEKGAGLN
jgi:hypothetical protein